MGLFDTPKPSAPSGKPMPSNNKPEPNKPKSIFSKNSGLGASRSDVQKEFMKMTDNTRSFGSHITSISEKRRMAQEILPSQKYGSVISPKEVDNRLKNLNSHMNLARRQGDYFEKTKFKDEIDALNKLKKLMGKK